MTTSTPRERWLVLTALGAGVLCLGAAAREPAPLVDTPPFECGRAVEVAGAVGRAGLVCVDAGPGGGTVADAVARAGGVVGCALGADDAGRALRAGDRLLVAEGERGACAVRVSTMDGERLLAL